MFCKSRPAYSLFPNGPFGKQDGTLPMVKLMENSRTKIHKEFDAAKAFVGIIGLMASLEGQDMNGKKYKPVANRVSF